MSFENFPKKEKEMSLPEKANDYLEILSGIDVLNRSVKDPDVTADARIRMKALMEKKRNELRDKDYDIDLEVQRKAIQINDERKEMDKN